MEAFQRLRIGKGSGFPGSGPDGPPINDSTRPTSSSSGPGAPQVVNISNNATVHERLFLAHGTAGPQAQEYDGSLLVQHHLNSFPPQRFPVSDGHFKALIHLDPGVNHIKLLFEGNGGGASSTFTLNYVPLLQNPPLNLVLILGKDSDGTFDSPKYKRDREGNGLELAVKKMRLAGYMMAAFTAEQMARNGFGHRTFRLHEEWQPDTLSNRDQNARNTAQIHVLRANKTVAEIRDPNRAQQNKNASDSGGLFGIALETIRNASPEFHRTDGHTTRVAALFLDAHWDPKQNLILGHAALGGGADNIKLAIFGSQAIHSWPSCLEELVPSLMDETRTDTSQVANDSGQSGTSWECLNIGMGAFMHEIGHLLGCPHQESGVMLRDYVTWNRSFTTRDGPFSTRTNKPGQRLVLAKDECAWHRLDTIRFRQHASFRLPHEYPPPLKLTKPNVYPLQGGALARSDSGIYLVEVRVDDTVRTHLDYSDNPQRELFLVEQELRDRIPRQYQGREKKLKLDILAVGEQQVTVDDFGELINKGRVSRPRGGDAFKSNLLGSRQGEDQMQLFPQTDRGIPPIMKVRIHAGSAVDGVEVFFENGASVLLGHRGGNPHDVNMRPGEQFVGLYARTGAWVDGMGVITTAQRGEVWGNKTGGSGNDMIPPQGFRIVGLYGSLRGWLTSIGLIYAEN